MAKTSSQTTSAAKSVNQSVEKIDQQAKLPGIDLELRDLKLLVCNLGKFSGTIPEKAKDGIWKAVDLVEARWKDNFTKPIPAGVKAERALGETLDAAASAATLINYIGLLNSCSRGKRPSVVDQKKREAIVVKLTEFRDRILGSSELASRIEAVSNDPASSPAMSFIAKSTLEKKDRLTKMGPELSARLVSLGSTGYTVHDAAKTAGDFKQAEAHLTELVACKRQMAQAITGGKDPYRACLADYAPDLPLEAVDALLYELRDGLLALKAKYPAAWNGKVSANAQKALALKPDEKRIVEFCADAVTKQGYPVAEQPFYMGSSAMSWNVQAPNFVGIVLSGQESLVNSILTSIHEGGHAVAYQGMDPEIAKYAPLFSSNLPSTELDEGLAFVFEMMVGQNKAFWKPMWEKMVTEVPGFDKVTLDEFVGALNAIRNSPVRLEADTVTYNLHIFMRYAFERKLIDGKLEVKDLPKAWSDETAKLFGEEYRPKNDAQGVLQDCHWYTGDFGYFPLYSIGRLVAAQIYGAAKRDIPDLEAKLEAGNTAALTEWMREKVYPLIGVCSTIDLVKKVSGKELGVLDYMAMVQGNLMRMANADNR